MWLEDKDKREAQLIDTIPVLNLEQFYFFLTGDDERKIVAKNTDKEGDHNNGQKHPKPNVWI